MYGEEVGMTTIFAQSEAGRRAVQWISEQLEKKPDAALGALVVRAAERFDLTPRQAEQLAHFYGLK